MSDDNSIRWTVTVSKETDIAVRTLLAQRGLKKGDLSNFIEEAVKWRVFDHSLQETRAAFADMSTDDLQALVDEAAEAVRQDYRHALASTPKQND
jgi:hypothetical protein